MMKKIQLIKMLIMKYLIKILFLGLLISLVYQCKNMELSRSIWLHNNSDKAVSYYIPSSIGIYYPDTILPEKNPKPWRFEKQYTYTFGTSGFTENELFNQFPTDTLSIFFFDPNTLAKYNWEIIRKSYKILIRYDLSHNDLKKLDWRVNYPPIGAMRGMKMYPKYFKD